MKKRKAKYRTDFLFPKTSFFIGMGSVFNVFGDFYKFNGSKTSAEADYKAIESDWGVIGQDIENAIDKFKKEPSLK